MSLQPLLHKNKNVASAACKCHFNVQNTKLRNIKITALGSCHRYQIIIIYITQKRGANCIYPTNPQIGWPKTTDNIFTLVSYGV